MSEFFALSSFNFISKQERLLKPKLVIFVKAKAVSSKLLPLKNMPHRVVGCDTMVNSFSYFNLLYVWDMNSAIQKTKEKLLKKRKIRSGLKSEQSGVRFLLPQLGSLASPCKMMPI